MKNFKKTFIAISFLMIAITANAADKGYLGIKFGAALPTGEFASNDTSNSTSGYGNLGYTMDVSAGIRIIGPLGIGAMVNYGNNNFEDLGSAEANILGTSNSISITGTKWSYYSFLIGPYVSIPLTDAFNLDFKLLFGTSTVNSPEIRTAITLLGNAFNSVQPSLNEKAFAMMLGTGLRINLSKRVSLLTALELFGTQPEYSLKDITTGGIEIKKYNVTNVNISAGIGVRF